MTNQFDARQALTPWPAGQHLLTLLEAINADDPALLDDLISTHFSQSMIEYGPEERYIRLYRRVRQASGGLVVTSLPCVRFEEGWDVMVRATGQGDGRPYHLHIQTDIVSPFLITFCDVHPALPPPTARIDVGGRALALWDLGRGTLPVVLEAGAEEGGETWSWIVEDLARETRVICYDRAGTIFGRSDPRPTEEQEKGISVGEMADDLHLLLTAAAVPSPYVLVGHSIGGMIIRMYAHRHPDAVAGLVLVDSTHPDQAERYKETLEPFTADEPDAVTEWRMFLLVDAEGVSGAERYHRGRSYSEVRATGHLDGKPLGVLVADLRHDNRRLPDMIVQANAEAWLKMQHDLAKLSTRSTIDVIEMSGHCIQEDAPEQVLAAIRRVLMEARASGAGESGE